MRASKTNTDGRREDLCLLAGRCARAIDAARGGGAHRGRAREQYRKALDFEPQFASVRDVLLPELDDGGQRGLRARLRCSR